MDAFIQGLKDKLDGVSTSEDDPINVSESEPPRDEFIAGIENKLKAKYAEEYEEAQNASVFEKTWRALKQGFDTGNITAQRLQHFNKELTPEQEAEYQLAERSRQAQAPQGNNWAESLLYGVANLVGFIGDTQYEGLDEAALGAAAGVTFSTPTGGLSIPAAAGIGMTIGSVKFMYDVGKAEAMAALEEAGLDPSKHDNIVNGVASLFAASEFSQVGSLLKPFTKQLAKRTLLPKAIETVAKKYTPALAERAVSLSSIPWLKSVVGTGIEYAKEIGEEAFQGSIVDAADTFVKIAEGLPLDKKDELSSILNTGLGAAKAAAGPMGVLSALGVGYHAATGQWQTTGNPKIDKVVDAANNNLEEGEKAAAELVQSPDVETRTQELIDQGVDKEEALRAAIIEGVNRPEINKSEAPSEITLETPLDESYEERTPEQEAEEIGKVKEETQREVIQEEEMSVEDALNTLGEKQEEVPYEESTESWFDNMVDEIKDRYKEGMGIAWEAIQGKLDEFNGRTEDDFNSWALEVGDDAVEKDRNTRIREKLEAGVLNEEITPSRNVEDNKAEFQEAIDEVYKEANLTEEEKEFLDKTFEGVKGERSDVVNRKIREIQRKIEAVKDTPAGKKAIALMSQQGDRTQATGRELVRDTEQAEGDLTGMIESAYQTAVSPESMSKAENKGKPITISEAEEVLKPLKERFKGVKVVVVDNFLDLPPQLRSRADRSTEGMWNPKEGVAYIIAGAHTDTKRLVGTFLEEAVGHGGVQEVLGNQFDKIVDLVINKYKNTESGKQIIKDYDIDLNKLNGQRIFADEVLAKLARGGIKDASLLDNVRSVINKILRELGFNVKLSEAEVRSLISNARRVAETKVTGNTRMVRNVSYSAKPKYAERKVLENKVRAKAIEIGLNEVKDKDTLSESFNRMAKVMEEFLNKQDNARLTDAERRIEANRFIAEHGLEGSRQAIMQAATSLNSDSRTFVILADRVINAYNNLIDRGQTKYESKLLELDQAMADQSRSLGQALNAFRFIARSSRNVIKKFLSKDQDKSISNSIRNNKEQLDNVKDALDNAGKTVKKIDVSQMVENTFKKGIPIWTRYTNSIMNAVLKESKSKDTPALAQMARTVRSILTQSKEGVKSSKPLSYIIESRQRALSLLKEQGNGFIDRFGIDAYNKLVQELSNPISEIELRRFAKDAGVDISKLIYEDVLKQKISIEKISEHLVNQAGIKDPALAKQIYDAYNNQLTEAKKKAILKLKEGGKVERSVKSQIQKIIDLHNSGAYSDVEVIKIIGERMGLHLLSEEQLNKAAQLAIKIKELEGQPIAEREAVKELGKYLRQQKGFGLGNYYWMWTYSSMLSGPLTQIRNLFSGVYNLVAAYPALKLSNIRGGSLKMHDARNLLKTILMSGNAFMYTIKTGNQTQEAEYMEQITGQAPTQSKLAVSDVDAISPSNIAGSLIKAFSVTVRRTMLAADEGVSAVARGLSKEVYLQELAHKKGLRGAEARKQVSQWMWGVDIDKAKEQAHLEGYRGTRAKIRVQEIIDQNNIDEGETTKQIEDSFYFGKKTSYNYKPEGTMGALAYSINNSVKNIPAIRHIIPFVTILSNVTDTLMDYSPWGYKRAYFGKGAFTSLEEFKTQITGRERQLQVAKATIGTAVLVTAYAMAKSGAIEVTGAGPTDKRIRKQLEALGWKPYTIKIGNQYISYALTPLAIPLSFVGSLRDHELYGKESKEDFLGRLVMAGMSFGGVIFQQTFLTGARSFMDAFDVSNEAQFGYNVQKFFGSFVGKHIPNLLKQTAQIFDPYMYKANTIKGAVLRQIPVVRGGMYKARDIWGEPIKFKTLSILLSKAEDDALTQWYIDNGLHHSVPTSQTQLNGVLMTSDQYEYYLENSLKKLRSELEKNFNRLSSYSNEKAQDEISRIQKNVNKEIKADMLRKGI